MNFFKKLFSMHVHDREYLSTRSGYYGACIGFPGKVYTEIRLCCKSCGKLMEETRWGFWKIENSKIVQYNPMTKEAFKAGLNEWDLVSYKWH